MPPLLNQTLQAQITRTYHLHVPDDPAGPTVPAIIVFHGGGQDAETIAARWSVTPAGPPPPPLDRYLLVFPEADPRLADVWQHFHNGDGSVPTHDLRFVDRLLGEISAATYDTGNPEQPTVTVDPLLVYAAGFSNGAGFVWQLMNSDRVSRFQGFAAVGHPLDPEKAIRYRDELGAVLPAPVPAIYVHGTGDPSFRSPASIREVPLDTTYPANSVREMLARNLIGGGPAVTTLAPGSTNLTEAVVQLFDGGAQAFEYVTVVGGGHNWPMPTTRGNPPVARHFDATGEIVTFWQNHAGLPS